MLTGQIAGCHATSQRRPSTSPTRLRPPSARQAGRRLQWRTFYPLVDTELLQPQPRPRVAKFSTIGQWYWGGGVEVDGEFPDLSKKFAFEPYLDLPRRVPEARFELAMNLNADDPEIARLRGPGLACRFAAWRRADTAGVSALRGERAGRIHRDQRRRRGLADGLGERSGGGVSRAGAAGDYGRYRCGKIFAARERVSLRSRHRRSGSGRRMKSWPIGHGFPRRRELARWKPSIRRKIFAISSDSTG